MNKQIFVLVILNLVHVFAIDSVNNIEKKSYIFQKNKIAQNKNKNPFKKENLDKISNKIYQQTYLSKINQKKYRSLKKALFLSLFVPGLGQAYVGHYVRSFSYLTIEISLLWSWYHFVITLQKRAQKNSQQFADQFYNLKKYEEDVIDNLNESDVKKAKIFPNRSDLCSSLHTPTNRDPNGPFLSCIDFGGNNQAYTTTAHYRVIQEEPTLNHSTVESIHHYRLNYFNDLNAFYEIINRQSDRISLGWVDVTAFNQPSAYQIKYHSLYKRTQELAKTQNLFLGGLILNHIVSAIDASIAAYFHNKNLYNEKSLPWYQQIKLQSFLNLQNSNLSTGLFAYASF